jgi:hypothetical protein
MNFESLDEFLGLQSKIELLEIGSTNHSAVAARPKRPVHGGVLRHPHRIDISGCAGVLAGLRRRGRWQVWWQRSGTLALTGVGWPRAKVFNFSAWSEEAGKRLSVWLVGFTVTSWSSAWTKWVWSWPEQGCQRYELVAAADGVTVQHFPGQRQWMGNG